MSDKLTAQHLIDMLVQRQGLDRDEATAFVRVFFALIEESLASDGVVKVKGLGTFKLIKVEDRESINVNTGERILIQGHTKVSFSPEAGLKDVINKPFAHFETVVLKNEALLDTTAQEENADNDMAPEDDNTQDSQEPTKDEGVSSAAIEIKEEELVPVKEQATEEKEEEKVQKEFDHEIYNTDEGQLDDSQVDVSPIKSGETDVEEPTEVLPTDDINAEIVAEVPEASPSLPEKRNKGNSLNKTLIVVVVLTIIICGGLIFSTYFTNLFPVNNDPEFPEEYLIFEDNDTVFGVDSVDVAVTDSTALSVIYSAEYQDTTQSSREENVQTGSATTVSGDLAQQEATQTAQRQQTPFSKIPVKPDSTNYEIVGTKALHTIVAGETLTRIAYKFYGTKDLYPYLIMHNRSIIKNPNVLPVGEIIVIPELRKKK